MMQTNAYREEQNFSIDPVSKNNPFKMHGEIFDKQGYRMDVTIWFRHKNEVFYYVDNEGELHGPMDKKHSINLAGVHKLGHGYNYHQESSRNAYESSNRPVSANLDGLLTDLDRLRKTNAERTYKASYSQEQTHNNTGHMSKWSSWTNNQFSQSPNRYATTVTRQHVKTTPQTVEVVVKRPPSLGASRIDITDNSRPFYRSSSTQIIQNESMSNREKMLIDELLETKRELQNIKRSQSQIGMQTPPVGRANGSQYFNEMWTTRSLRKAEGPPNWKMQTSPRPIRTVSQTNLLSQPTRIPNNWTSETNIRTNNLKTGYSAHRENTNNAALLNEIHNRESYNARNAVDGKYYEELEVITLQPIGKGVQDLQSGTFTSTLPRSAGFRSGQHSPSISNFNRQKFTYESSTNDIRSKTATGKNYMSPQISISNAGHVNAGNMGIGGVAGQMSEAELGIRSVIDTQNIWYRPDSSRDEVISMLRDEEPGSFIIRKSSTFPNSYGLALKVHKIINRMNDRADDRDPELVRHFLIEGVEGGVHLRGFAEESVYKSLSHFVHHHTIQRDALPCCLRLMHNGRAVSVGANSNLIQRTNNNFTMARSGSVGSRDFHQNHVIRPNGQIDYLDRNRRIKFELAYLGSVVVDKLNGDRAARKATTDILSQFESDGLPKKCIVSVEAIPGEGIHIQEYSRRINLKKFIKSSDVEWIGFDPEYRKFHDKRLTGISESGIIALILKKHRIILTENSALLFAELNPSMSSSIIDYIRMNFG